MQLKFEFSWLSCNLNKQILVIFVCVSYIIWFQIEYKTKQNKKKLYWRVAGCERWFNNTFFSCSILKKINLENLKNKFCYFKEKYTCIFIHYLSNFKVKSFWKAANFLSKKAKCISCTNSSCFLQLKTVLGWNSFNSSPSHETSKSCKHS